jgi:hypothetical protein
MLGTSGAWQLNTSGAQNSRPVISQAAHIRDWKAACRVRRARVPAKPRFHNPGQLPLQFAHDRRRFAAKRDMFEPVAVARQHFVLEERL